MSVVLKPMKSDYFVVQFWQKSEQVYFFGRERVKFYYTPISVKSLQVVNSVYCTVLFFSQLSSKQIPQICLRKARNNCCLYPEAKNIEKCIYSQYFSFQLFFIINSILEYNLALTLINFLFHCLSLCYIFAVLKR